MKRYLPISVWLVLGWCGSVMGAFPIDPVGIDVAPGWFGFMASGVPDGIVDFYVDAEVLDVAYEGQPAEAQLWNGPRSIGGLQISVTNLTNRWLLDAVIAIEYPCWYGEPDIFLGDCTVYPQAKAGGEVGAYLLGDMAPAATAWTSIFFAEGFDPSYWDGTFNAGSFGFNSGSSIPAYSDASVLFADYLPGDASRDGIVNVGDLGILASHWDTASGMLWSQADFSGDGAVDVADLGMLAGRWQQTSAWYQAPPGAPLPEPATILLMALGALAVRRPR